MLISTISYNAIPLTTVFSQLFTFLLLSSHLLIATVCIIKSFLCHDKQAMSCHIISWKFMSQHVICDNYHGTPNTQIYVTGPAKINHVSANYTELYFRQYLQP